MTEPTSAKFREGFSWGAASAAYQIEGAWNADGKGPSVWDQMSHSPGRIHRGETGDMACDHYHRYDADVTLMREIGLNAYRLSLSWPRILPEGRGSVNARGLAFYDALVDSLLAREIEPWVTLFHWDFPLALYERGGWLNPESPQWFADYTAVVAGKLGDRVKHWITLNEPQMFVWLGHQTGKHAPGLELSLPELARISHHVLLAHGKACQVLRQHGRDDTQIGWAPAHAPTDVADPGDRELVAYAEAETFRLHELKDFTFNTAFWNEPALRGVYPQAYLESLGDHLPDTWQEDLKLIHQPLDFCGLNIYTCHSRAERDSEGNLSMRPSSEFPPVCPRNQMDWPIVPEALYWGPKTFYDRYRLPIVITENGTTLPDWRAVDGGVHDPNRIDFLQRYLGQLKRAACDGVDVRGYFHWSLMDNFEWAEGYRQRFGLIHVDYATLERTIKDSGHFYCETVRCNGDNISTL